MHQLVSNINRKRLNLPGKDDVENPLHCKICLQIFNEPYSTICGHTFCRACITRSIQHSPQCPICDTNLDVKRLKTLCPNFTVSSMIDKMLVDVETNEVHGKGHSSPDNGQPDNGDQILQMIQNQKLSLESVQRISELLKRRQMELELNNQQIQNLLLNDFIDRMIVKRENTAKIIQAELDTLRRDKQHVFNTLSSQLSPSSLQRLVPDSHQIVQALSSSDQAASNTSDDHLAPLAGVNQLRSDSPSIPQTRSINLTEKLCHYRLRMCRHVTSLESAYFGSKTAINAKNSGKFQADNGPSIGSVDLDEFSETLKRLYQYGDMKLLATLNYNLESNSSLSIVSSIGFDKDGEFFVIAGVAKKIKLYNYDAVINFEGELHYPLEQLICNSKIRYIFKKKIQK